MISTRSAISLAMMVVTVLPMRAGERYSTLSSLGGHRPKCRALRFPGKERFPSPEEELLRLRDEQQVPEMRAHAWKLFAGLTRAGGAQSRLSPVWATWYTECEVKLEKCLPASEHPSNTERLLRGF